MKRSLRWALLPVLIAGATAMSPFGMSSNGSGVVGVNDAQCLDCTESANHTCGTPPLDREGYCTSGSSWCKEAES